ncbi:MAG: single-stranded DNA-binding protein [Akkermansia sp.]|nr:single-stranded DNA-binding protein [Akkermansia sp.]
MNERLATLATEAATAVLTPLGFEFTLETTPYEEDSVQIMVTSPDARYIIGDEGDRLDDLQYLVNRLVQAQWETAPRVRVDCDSYRARAEEKLLRRARSRAERVLQTGQPLMMEKLNAYQRRLVHNALAQIPGIATCSEETDSRFKRITISRAE